MQKALEHQEHAQHVADHGSKHAALLVALLAALLAVTEQQAKLAEVKVSANAVLAADSWDQFQGKSTRLLMSQDLAQIADTLDVPTDPAMAARRMAVVQRLRDDAKRFQDDPKDSKEAIAKRAAEFEGLRDEALERAHTFDKAAAALELGIVLSTASAITSSKMLIRIALVLGVVGLVLGVLGIVDPRLGAW
jgi:Domain of unknown function (DUF4337)